MIGSSPAPRVSEDGRIGCSLVPVVPGADMTGSGRTGTLAASTLVCLLCSECVCGSRQEVQEPRHDEYVTGCQSNGTNPRDSSK